MAQGMCELLLLNNILQDLKIKWEGHIKLYWHIKSTISISHNLVQHDQTKAIDVDGIFQEKLG